MVKKRAERNQMIRNHRINALAVAVVFGVIGTVLFTQSHAATPPGFYVSPSGNDNNAGTSAAPFATFTKCRTAMRASSTVKTCYLMAGLYHPTNMGSGCTNNTNAIYLGSQDAGETWSYDPAAGYNTANIDGGATSASTGLEGGICIDTDNVTIDGLLLHHFRVNFIHVFGVNNTITNNIVHDSYDQPFVAAIKMDVISTGTRVTHNVVYNVASNGISAHSCNGGFGGCSGGITNDYIAYNVVYNYCYNDYDCGAVEFQDYDSPRSTNIQALYNYVWDGDLIGPNPPANDSEGIGGGRALYLDDGSSNVTYQGNIVTGKNELCIQIHGGHNDIYKNNICDIQTPTANQNIGNTGMSIVYSQESDHNTAGMAGNKADNNIIIGNDSHGGYGYDGDGTAPANPEVSNTAYHNYVTGPTTSCYSGGINFCGSAGRDSSPQNISNLFNTCPSDGADPWSFELNSNSPALAAPVSFPQPANDRSVLWGRPGFWGPPGYTIPHVGNKPSYNPCNATGPLVGDLNSDGKVNVTDLSILLTNWGTSNAVADINGDHMVNITDLSMQLSHWTG